jgi:hypothetical protein
MKKASASKSSVSTVAPALRDKIDKVLGSPTVLAGDDEEQFNRLESALIAHINPQDIFEEIWTREIVEYLFEILRLRRWKIRILELREKNALSRFMMINHGSPVGTETLLSQWFRREPEAENRILELISPVERSYEHVEANTVFFNLEAITALDSLLQAAETGKDGAIKELELYRDRQAKRGVIDGSFKNITGSEVVNDKLQKG